MSSDVAISINRLSKCYEVYDEPVSRLKQFILPKISRLFGRAESKYYKEFWSLKNISFEIKRGETVGIIGCNGSGKSTLLQIICGTLSQTSGSVQTEGRIAALLELGSGFNPEFTGRENIYLNGAVLGLTEKEIESKYSEIISFADIGEFVDQPVKFYSSGMMVRLAFSVAINVDPQILIVDEALSVGDELFQRKCFSRIESIRKSGATILFVSHSGGTIVELCDRAILLDAGELLAIDNPKQIVGRYQKLLYSPPELRNQLRDEIRGKNEFNKVHINTPDLEPSYSVELSDNYDPSLKPKSTIEYASYGAIICDPAIYTEMGGRVNNLTRGKFYLYRYKVKFEKAANNVRFGMLIKTTSGLELGGAATAASHRTSLSYVEISQTYEVEIRFCCRLNPGVFFLNAGVLGEVHGHETFLHRLIDAAMFRVMSERDILSTGTVDFDCTSKLTLIN